MPPLFYFQVNRDGRDPSSRPARRHPRQHRLRLRPRRQLRSSHPLGGFVARQRRPRRTPVAKHHTEGVGVIRGVGLSVST